MFHATSPIGYFVFYTPAIEQIGAYTLHSHKDMALNQRYTHTFCGQHDISGAQCPNCRKPLLCFLQLDVRDPRLLIQNSVGTSLSLLYCWTCQGAGGSTFFYRNIDQSKVIILEYGITPFTKGFPYKNYPIYFPKARALLHQLKPDVQQYIRRLNREDFAEYELPEQYQDLDVPRHQIGGEPYLIQHNPDYIFDKVYGVSMDCPICGNLMPFFAAIGDHCTDPRGFTGNEFVQVLFHYCSQCCVVAAFNQCD